MTTAMTAEPTGLRAAKREQAKLRKELAAADTPAKKAPAKTPPAKKAPAKAPAKKAAAKAPAKAGTSPAKLRWQIVAEHKGGKEQNAAYGKGQLAIVKAGEAWKAVYREGQKETVLVDACGFGKAYNAAVAYSKGTAE